MKETRSSFFELAPTKSESSSSSSSGIGGTTGGERGESARFFSILPMVMGAERTTTTFFELPLELAELLAELVELPLELTELPQEPDRSLGESKLPFFCIRSKLPE